ncbi:MAG TPA: glycosyltransferase family 4 protein [Vicinamibacterales bacterium]|jgi:glycosyltransferase involved in cell wall biosynthesis
MFSLQIDTARSWRGGQNQVLLTTRGLCARGHRVAVVAHPDGELRRRLGDEVPVVPLAPRNEVDLPAAWRLSRVIKDLQPDVVHAHDPHGVAVAATALSIASPPRKPVLIAARRVDFHLKTNSFSKWKYRQVDRFITASNAIRAMLLEDGIAPERVVTVHEGVDVDRIRAVEPLNLREEYWFPPHSLIVGNIAALVPHKGQKYLVEAAALVTAAMPEARFVILGDGELRSALEQQIKQAHLGQHVILGGFRMDVLALLKGLDLFVMSSVTEGLGTSLLDAMAAGRAIVGTTAGGIPEVVAHGETGLLVPPRDGRAMADAILTLLRDQPRRHQMAQAGFVRVREQFSVERMVDATIAIYERLADTSRATDTARRETAD